MDHHVCAGDESFETLSVAPVVQIKESRPKRALVKQLACDPHRRGSSSPPSARRDRRGPIATSAHEIHPTFSADMIPTAVST